MESPRRRMIHRSSIWTNEEHNLLYSFWRKNVDKIDLPGRTEDKLKNKIYNQIQESFAKKGFRRSVKQIRKKIQNLKREVTKYKDVNEIEDEVVRERVITVQKILAMNEPERDNTSPKDQNTSTVIQLAQMIGGQTATANSSNDHWPQLPPLSEVSFTDPGSSQIMSDEDFKREIIKLTENLNKAITSNDYKTYEQLCDPSLTCFEPEAFGNLVEGLEFHKFYFDSNAFSVFTGEIKVSIVNPKVHRIGNDAACIAYVRILQGIRRDTGLSESLQSEETRLWKMTNWNNQWKCFHFHRSQNYKQK